MAQSTTIAHLAPAKPQPVIIRLGANNAFIGACQDFDDLIAKLQAARALHFGVDADKQRDWSEAGSVAAMNAKLAEALAFITCTAE